MNFTTKIKDINIAATLPFSVGIGHSINNEVEEIDLSKCPQENSYFMDFEMSSTLKVSILDTVSEKIKII